jgi:hypothetical protein
MARATASAARAETAPAPAHPPARRAAPPSRRRSGPAAKPPRGATVTKPARGATVAKPVRRATVAKPVRVAPAVGRFVEARTAGLIDRLLRGRLWVGFIGALLAGIVFLNVSLLELNRDIARTTVHATALDRANSALRARLAGFDSSERIQRLAEARGMVMPAPGQYRYLRARPWLDAAMASQRVTSPRLLASSAGSTAPATTAPAATPATAAPVTGASTAAAQSTAGSGTTATAAPAATAGTP